MLTTARLRGERGVRASFAGVAATPGNGRRTVFDCKNGTFLPSAVLARSEDGPESADDSVNRAFDGLGATRDFYKTVFNRDSIDGQGMRLDAFAHFGERFNNAFWDGQQMVFGDGDGKMFSDFTGSVDVIGHELTHGVTELTAALKYHNQSGALNESMSDVFGSLVKQWSLKQSVDEADWLIGPEIFTPGIDGDALRSMKAPGHAYDNALFGRDPQPDHMEHFVKLPDTERGDLGGVHVNSGIPNKAFFLTAVRIGGFAWEAPGLIWYESLKASNPETQFQEFANTTYRKAAELFGEDSAEQLAVLAAWQDVGIQISGILAGVARARSLAAGRNGGAGGDKGMATVSRQIGALAVQVTGLAKDVTALKGK
ncbi:MULTISPECIES: M4 family metallopeptidase [unclassified Streptomyces]|uniref:M4 family metallopeptidase n=1 Tax=unclassified Streptomyces TaxID=2593676 RepID=UPI0033B016B6